MLYSGLTVLPRSVFWLADLNGRSDNTDVITLNSIPTLMKFLCSNCFYEKEIPPDAAPKYAGKNVTCPKCKLKSRVDPDSSSPTEEPLPIATVSSASPKASKLPLILGLGCGIPILGLIALASLLFLMPSATSNPAAFVESVDVNDSITLTAQFHNDKIYIPLNTDYYQCIPYDNRWIDIEIIRNGNRLEPTAGLFNIDGTPTELSCKTNNTRICECSIVNGNSACLYPKAPGKFTVSIEFMGKQVHCNIEFIQIPLRVYDDNELPQKTAKLIEKIGFPDSKKQVHAKKSGETVDGFPHELTGVYEHWRYDRFPRLIIATYNDDIIGIMTEQ